MCGLFGCKTLAGYNQIMTKEERELKRKILEGLAITMEERGKDSTGIVAINGKKDFSIVKKTICAEKFVNDKSFQKTLRTNPEIIIGHTRLATVGEVSERNAHPFRRGNIIGAHNGSVSNYKKFSHANLEVDSEAIFYLLKKCRNNFKKAFKKLAGQFAITWADLKDEHVIYLVRDGNPLYAFYSDRLKSVFWCSQRTPLVILARMAGNKIKEIEIDEEKVVKLEGNGKTKEFPIEFASYYEPTSRSFSNGYYDSEGAWHNYPAWKNYKSEDDDEIDYEDYMTKEEKNRIIRKYSGDGCSFCSDKKVRGTLYYDWRAEYIICEECFKAMADYPDAEFYVPIEADLTEDFDDEDVIFEGTGCPDKFQPSLLG